MSKKKDAKRFVAFVLVLVKNKDAFAKNKRKTRAKLLMSLILLFFGMKLQIFSALSKMNKTVLPKLWDKADLANLTTKEKAIIGWKRWVTLNYLAEKEKHKKTRN
jgi:hypothetical protein